MNALLASKVCDVTGVIAIACARHGCYVPNALVDLFKGKQQKNVDFALLWAIEFIGIEQEQGLLIIYDIVCQYIVHLEQRIGNQLPPGLTVNAAIGLFHVHAHKDDCFFRFATSFIPGAVRATAVQRSGDPEEARNTSRRSEISLLNIRN